MSAFANRLAVAAAALVITTNAVLAFAGAPPDSAPAAAVLKALREAHPGTSFGAVRATPLRSVFEVQMGENVAYVVEGDTRHILFGRLYDTLENRVLGATPPRPAAAAAADPLALAALPAADALVEVQGDGKRRLVVFSDPACGYCRQLAGTLSVLKNVTIHTYIVPFQGMDTPLAVWCAPNRMQAWAAAMAGQVPQAPASSCANPIERNAALAARLHVTATPTLFFADGTRIEGASSLAAIESQLNAAQAQERQ